MRHARWFPLIMMFAFLISVYRLTAPPELTWQHGGADGAELALVAQRLGVAHPPGYALYTLLGWAFVHVIVAQPVVAMQWLSHATALAACGLLVAAAYRLALRYALPSPRAAGLNAALALGLSRTFWSQAIIVEVYTLMTALFCALLLIALTQSRIEKLDTEARRHSPSLQSNREKFLLSPQSSVLSPFLPVLNPQSFLLGHLFGLALTHHLTALLWLPGLAWLLRKIGRRGWHLLAMGVLTGLWPWLLMLARAGADPVANWGGVNEGFASFLAHVTGEIYRGLLAAPSLERIVQGIGAWFANIPADFTWVGVVLIVIGIAAAWRARQFDLLIASALWVVALVVFTGLYSGDNTSDVYRLPLTALAALYLALGGAWLFRHLALIGRGLPLLVATLLIAANYSAVDLSADNAVKAFFLNAIGAIPPRAVVVTSRDEETFALWYFIWAEGHGYDWMLVNDRLLRYEWYRDSLAKLYPSLAPVPDTLSAWIRSDALASYSIASPGLISPPPGRASRRVGGWYLLSSQSG